MRKTLLACLTAATIGGAAIAQMPPPPPPGMDPAQAQAARADDMALLLGLRPDQRPALDQLLGAMTPPDGGDRDAWRNARRAATETFRAALSPDQQARFDALERLRHGFGPRMGGQQRRWGGGEGQ